MQANPIPSTNVIERMAAQDRRRGLSAKVTESYRERLVNERAEAWIPYEDYNLGMDLDDTCVVCGHCIDTCEHGPTPTDWAEIARIWLSDSATEDDVRRFIQRIKGA